MGDNSACYMEAGGKTIHEGSCLPGVNNHLDILMMTLVYQCINETNDQLYRLRLPVEEIQVS